MKVLLPLLAVLSAVASLIGVGLSGMASDDVSRPTQAHAVQLLQLAWLAASIVTPFIAWRIARRDVAASHRAYIPMALVALAAIASLYLY